MERGKRMLCVTEAKSRKIERAERREDRLYLYSEAGMHRLEPKNDRTIRITYTQNEAFSEEVKPGVICHEVFRDWDYTENETELCFYTEHVKIVINRETASFRYLDGEGKCLLKERGQDSKTLEEFTVYQLQEDSIRTEKVVTPDGVKEVVREAAKIPAGKSFHTRLHLEWAEEEALYGLGQQEEGFGSLRGQVVYLHQANRKIAIPMLVSTLGYGILMDTYSPMIFSDTMQGSYLYTEADREMDYYFMNGGTMDGVVGEYRRLTGKASLLPRWAFGYLQSQERYETQEEILEVADEYRKRGIGLDGIVLDWCSWEDNQWGQKTFDSGRFPEPGRMVEELHDRQVHFMLSIWPNMAENTENYQEFREQGLLLPGCTVYNALSGEGRELYWQQLKKGLLVHGVDAWWCDSSEPFTPEWNHPERVEPAVMYAEYCNAVSNHLPVEKMNAFGLYHARGIYEGQRAENEKRVVNLTRSAYTGQQRYGTILWSGDTEASWDTLRRQVAAGLHFCASGLPFWTVDIGAFFVKRGNMWYWKGEYPEGCQDLGYRELFVRWFQWGAFLPVFRGHGTDCRRELWHYENAGQPFYDALLAANRLRYELIPYIYSYAGLCWLKDQSMIRLLAFAWPEDREVWNITDQ
ncbi:MAG: TIM-barrel domain-containing protein, partial [Lachnospiraceae bacterium]